MAKRKQEPMGNLNIENAQLIFRNFSGNERKSSAHTVNPAGRRNFCVKLDDNIASAMLKDGWNIKYLRPRDEDEAPQAYMQVSVSYENRPPKIEMITSRGKTRLNEDTVGLLDAADISTVDLVIRPYEWGPINGQSGIKAYCKSMYVTIAEDEFERKYNAKHDDYEEEF